MALCHPQNCVECKANGPMAHWRPLTATDIRQLFAGRPLVLERQQTQPQVVIRFPRVDGRQRLRLRLQLVAATVFERQPQRVLAVGLHEVGQLDALWLLRRGILRRHRHTQIADRQQTGLLLAALAQTAVVTDRTQQRESATVEHQHSATQTQGLVRRCNGEAFR